MINNPIFTHLTMLHMKKIVLLGFCMLVGTIMAQAQSAPADSTLKEFTGKYKFPEGSVVLEVNVALDNGNLTMSSSVGNSALEKQGEDTYSIVQFQGTAKFNRDSNRKIIGVSIVAMGYQLEGTKTDTTPLAFQLSPVFARTFKGVRSR
jgi:hypothetical protein